MGRINQTQERRHCFRSWPSGRSSCRQQEEEDRQMAPRLQKQLDQEEALYPVDCSKGSRDQYQLCQKPGPSSGRSCSSTSKEVSGTAERSLSGPAIKVEQRSTQRSSSLSITSSTATHSDTRKSSKQATPTDKSRQLIPESLDYQHWPRHPHLLFEGLAKMAQVVSV